MSVKTKQFLDGIISKSNSQITSSTIKFLVLLLYLIVIPISIL